MVRGDSCEEIVNKLQPRNGSVYEMSKLQHLNLMRILGLCVELEVEMWIYRLSTQTGVYAFKFDTFLFYLLIYFIS